jgi:hypothetical protein
VNRDSSWVAPALVPEHSAAAMVAAIAMIQLAAVVPTAALALAEIAAVALLAAVAAVVKIAAFDHNHARDCPYAERWCYSLHSAFQKGVAASYYS